MKKIQYINVNKLTKLEQITAKKITQEYYGKLNMVLRDLESVSLHVKTHSNKGKTNSRKKFNIHVRVISPKHSFESSEGDWDFERTLHKAFKDVEHQLHHKLKDN